ncbi:MAG: hypothetical protein HRF50_12580 [Phycisphaerae bacterium]|jgi:hypothetical protein
MNENQYRHLLTNSAPPRLRPVLADEIAAGFVRQAAQRLRRREALERALEQIGEPGWRGAVRVAGYADGMVCLEARDEPTAAAITSARGRLLRELSALVPGVRALEVVVAGARWTDDDGAA